MASYIDGTDISFELCKLASSKGMPLVEVRLSARLINNRAMKARGRSGGTAPQRIRVHLSDIGEEPFWYRSYTIVGQLGR